MAGSKHRSKRARTASARKQSSPIGRYLIFGGIAVVAIAAVIFLTRDKSGVETTKSSAESEAGLVAPMRTEFLKEGLLSFYNAANEYIATVDIELAEGYDERRLGLMFRKSMGENQGMLFLFPYDAMQSFWMKNTILPLDMIFINSNNEIVTIHKNTEPYAETQYPSSRPAKYVLEVNAGYCDRIGISEGDKIGWMRTN